MKLTKCKVCEFATTDDEHWIALSDNVFQCPYCGAKYNLNEETEEEETKQETGFEKFIFNKETLLNPNAKLQIGLAYLNGSLCNKDEAKATNLFYSCAMAGNVEGIFQYAESLFYGRGIEKDIDKAKIYYEQACEMGHVGAKIKLKEIKQNATSLSTNNDANGKQQPLSMEEVIEKVRPYCVEIICKCEGMVNTGSGFIIDNGLIITNAHVVMNSNNDDTADNIYLGFDFQRKERLYEINVISVSIKEDIALCSFKDYDVVKSLPNTLTLLPLDEYRIGSDVFTFGNGVADGLKLSHGKISKGIQYNYDDYSEVVCTDMIINQGNSGGALFDINGNVIGMMTFVLPVVLTNDQLSNAFQMDVEMRGIAYGISYAVTSRTIIKFIQDSINTIEEFLK